MLVENVSKVYNVVSTTYRGVKISEISEVCENISVFKKVDENA